MSTGGHYNPFQVNLQVKHGFVRNEFDFDILSVLFFTVYNPITREILWSEENQLPPCIGGDSPTFGDSPALDIVYGVI